jgi:integrase/recombinase XerC
VGEPAARPGAERRRNGARNMGARAVSVSDENQARKIRQKADAIGLRMRRRGNVYDLRDDAGLVITGPLSSIEAYVGERWVGKRPGPKPRVRPPAAWAVLSDDYVLTLAAAGRSIFTMKLRRCQLTTMSRELGGRPGDVTGEQLVEWLGRHTEWMVETRRSNRAAVRGFFLWAYKANRIPVHIADDLPKIRQAPAMPRPATDAAWHAALAAADRRTTLILRLAAEAGLRRSEIAQVHTRDLMEGVDGAQLLVHGKGSKQRIVPLSTSLAELIRPGGAGHTPGASPNGWLFPNGSGGHLGSYHVGDLARRVLPDHWTLHTGRHRFASRAYRGTRNLRAVQVLLGHSSISTTERYCAVDDSEIRATMEAAGA